MIVLGYVIIALSCLSLTLSAVTAHRHKMARHSALVARDMLDELQRELQAQGGGKDGKQSAD